MDISVREIIDAIGGELIHGKETLRANGVSTDSRKESRGAVFFALKGPNFDGHRFASDVLKRGASVAVVDTADLGEIPPGASVIRVKDTLFALGALGRYIRGLYDIPLIAISGSAGKTTTKEMTASILSQSRKVLKTEGNLNNLIGLPLTLFGLDNTHKAAVIELGISEFFEMDRLVDICAPDVALLTNIGRAHLMTLGSIEGVARAKGPLFTKLGPDKYRAVNLDDPLIRALAGNSGSQVTFSLKEKADVRVREYSVEDSFGGATVLYEVAGKDVTVRFNAPGATNIVNGAAAIAATLPLGPSLKEIEDGLSSFSPVHGRMEILKVDGFTVLDDTYNANPDSMASALRTLAKASGRKVAVIGDMLELGEASSIEHYEIGLLSGRLGVDVVIAIGAFSGEVSGGAKAGGVRGAEAFGDKKDALDALKKTVKAGDAVLVKASRGVGLEYIVEGLKTSFAEAV
ncbi:MAG: UDP-N-acetylmuramoyl-tripeptide--D-alanyl-D-alanine ligase [Deltaproteobacteria bacterium]|nr:UDP-N-acetylmuramoyl-tripeptide--D-alanyl-D-alanine ligase [Deltaproteobacteria bacterium]